MRFVTGHCIVGSVEPIAIFRKLPLEQVGPDGGEELHASAASNIHVIYHRVLDVLEVLEATLETGRGAWPFSKVVMDELFCLMIGALWSASCTSKAAVS